MSAWPEVPFPVPVLSGSDGELQSVRVAVDPRLLEELLEALAELPFPINPQICHQSGAEHARAVTLVEFPAYAGHLDEVRQALTRRGFGPDAVTVSNILFADAEPRL